MGVELLKIPAKLAPSGNPMNFKVRAGNYAISGHRLTAQIQIETVPDSGIFHALPVMNLDPDETGVADLDVALSFTGECKQSYRLSRIPGLPVF